MAEALWEAGVPRDVLALVDIDEGSLGQRLLSHPDVDRVILTGSWETAALFRSWRPDLPLLAETSGKNAMIVMPSADLDLAAGDVIKSAFGHAGQKCSAASLAILVGPVGRSRALRAPAGGCRDLAARRTAERPAGRGRARDRAAAGQARVGPVDPRRGRAVARRAEAAAMSAPEFAGRFWSPGIRTGVQPGSRFHQEEFFGPVLGIMHAHSLAHAIELQNAVAYGLTAGLYTQNPDDLAMWLDGVEAGNLYVNRGITGAIVQRQPFGGWKRSSVGAGTKAGGPNYLVGLGSWRATVGRRRIARRCTCAGSTRASRRSSRRPSRRWTTTRSSGCAAARCRTRSRGTASSDR